MIWPSKDFDFLDYIAAHLVMWQHTPYRTADHTFGMLGKLCAKIDGFNSARVSRVTVIEFVFELVPGYPDKFCIDYNYEIA